MRYYCTPIKRAIIKKTKDNNKCSWGRGDRTLIILLVRMNSIVPLWKPVWQSLPRGQAYGYHTSQQFPSYLYTQGKWKHITEKHINKCSQQHYSLLTVKKWKQSKCLSTDEWINKICYMHTMEYYPTNMNEALLHATRSMNLENIMLSERTQW